MAHFSPLHRMGSALVAVTLALSAVGAGVADAATTTNAWQAKVGSAGANGTARIVRYTTATGALTLKFTRLRASTILPVVVYKGSCGSVGAVLFKLASIKTTSSGAASRTSSLTSAQLNLVLAATTGTGKIAIRVGTGTSTKCGVFAKLAVPAYVAATVPIGQVPTDVAFLGTQVWVAGYDSLTRIDPATNVVLSAIPLPQADTDYIAAVASAAGSLWVLVVSISGVDFEYLAGSVLRIDPASGTVVATVAVSPGSSYLAGDAAAMWVSSPAAGTIQRIDPAINQVAATLPFTFPGPIAVGADGVWAATDLTTVSRIDPATNLAVANVTTADWISAIAVSPGAVWVGHGGTSGVPNGSVSRINPGTAVLAAFVPVGFGVTDVSASGGNVWASMDGETNVIRINAATNTIVKVAVGTKTQSIAANAQGVWVAPSVNFDAGSLPMNVIRINY